MDTFPTVNPTDFHMTNYDPSLYADVEKFCSETEITVDYFLQEFAVNEQQLRQPSRRKSILNDF